MKRKKRLSKDLMVFTFAILLYLNANTQSLRLASGYRQKIDKFLSVYASNIDFSGSLMISLNGKTVYSKSYGKANYELNTAQSLSTKIRVASVTKTFIAAGVILLKDRGQLSLEDSLTKFIPQYPNGNKVRIKYLLGHAGGIPPLNNNMLFQPSLTNDSILNYLMSKPFDYEPGTSDAYSNTGYFLLARIIEKVSGQELGQFLAKNIFDKLSMKNTGLFDDEKLIMNKAAAYSPGPFNGLMNTPWYSSKTLFGSGNIYSSVEDLCKWGNAIHDKTLFDIYRLNYPSGWGRRKLDSLKYLSQTGYNEGYNSLLLVFENGLVISYLNNIGNLLFNKIERDIPAILLGKPYNVPQRVMPFSLNPEKLKGYTGIYSNNGNRVFKVFEEDQSLYFQFFDSKFKNYLFPAEEDFFIMKNEFSYLQFNRTDELIKSVTISFSKEDKGTIFLKD